MVKMNFTNPVLEKIARSWKLSRNNTLLILDKAIENNILDFAPKIDKKVSYTFQPVIFQFQCLVTTTDTYIRKITGHKNKSYGILVTDGKVVNKKDLPLEQIKSTLESQMTTFENLLKPMTNKEIDNYIRMIMSVCNHEYLHQGELTLMLREAGVDLPDRFKRMWAL